MILFLEVVGKKVTWFSLNRLGRTFRSTYFLLMRLEVSSYDKVKGSIKSVEKIRLGQKYVHTFFSNKTHLLDQLSYQIKHGSDDLIEKDNEILVYTCDIHEKVIFSALQKF